MPARQMTDADRERAIAMLRANMENVREQFSGLSDAQWTYREAEGRWTLAELAAHLATVEKRAGKAFSGYLVAEPEPLAPAAPLDEDFSGRDERIIALIGDRSRRIEAPDFLQPKPELNDHDVAFRTFLDAREKLIDMVGQVRVNLRARQMSHPVAGPVDGVQWLFFIAAHGDRHVDQMRELKRGPGYPQ